MTGSTLISDERISHRPLEVRAVVPITDFFYKNIFEHFYIQPNHPSQGVLLHRHFDEDYYDLPHLEDNEIAVFE